jgi:MFS family permease
MTGVYKPLFRGWYVAATLSICGVALYGAGLYSFILFVTPLSNEFHWSRAAVGTLVSAFWLAAPLLIVSDRLIRRLGTWRLVIAGIVIEATCLMLLFTASHLWEMYLLRTLAGLGKILYAVTIPNILSKWFSRRFGFALAVVYCGWHVGGLVLAPVAQALISSFGWRLASAALGFSIVVIALPPTLWFLRTPSAAALGLGLDGDRLTDSEVSRHIGVVKEGGASLDRASFNEVIRNKAFVFVTIASCIYCLSYSGVLAHQAAAIVGAGISAETASLVVGSTAGFAVVGALTIGWCIDRYTLRWVTVLQYGLIALGIAFLLAVTHVPSVWLLAFHALLYGLSIGGTDVFWITSLKRRVPDDLFATAYGLWYFMELVGTVAGPGLAGLLYDRTGSYQTSLAAAAANLILPFVMSLAIALMPNPNNGRKPAMA